MFTFDPGKHSLVIVADNVMLLKLIHHKGAKLVTSELDLFTNEVLVKIQLTCFEQLTKLFKGNRFSTT